MTDQQRQFRARRRRELRSPLGVPAVFGSERLTRGHGTLADQFAGDEENFNKLLANCRARGIRPGTHDVYNPAIACTALDPEALVPQADPEGHIRRKCLKDGLDCRGLVDVTIPKTDAMHAADEKLNATP